jgi:sulfate transport system permease protein
MLSLKKSTKPKEWDYKPLLIIVALVYLALLLFIPAAAVFYYAFRNGFQAFLEAAGTSDFIEAVRLTVIIALITVPLNTIFGLCAAWVIARNQFRGKTLLISLIDIIESQRVIGVGYLL